MTYLGAVTDGRQHGLGCGRRRHERIPCIEMQGVDPLLHCILRPSFALEGSCKGV